jgi:hypothetical protein
MLRIASTSILILAGGVVTATLVCLLALRVLCSVLFALSGNRRHEQVLNW